MRSLQLYTIHDITCGPILKTAALELLTAVAEAEVDEGVGQQTEAAAMVLGTSRWGRRGTRLDGLCPPVASMKYLELMGFYIWSTRLFRWN